MGKIVIVKCLIALVVVCTENDTGCQGGLNQQQMNHANYIGGPQHWQEMWFSFVKTTGARWASKRRLSTDSRYGPLDRLRTTPFLMGCGYGQKLNDFLRLTVYTIELCTGIRQKFVAEDCWSKLKTSVATASRVLSHLLKVFALLRSFHVSVIESPFSEPMERIQLLLQRQQVPSQPMDPRPMVCYAEILEALLNSECQPKTNVVDTELLAADYGRLNTIMNLYDFYVHTLDSYTGFISGHLHRLGFRYEETCKTMFYITPEPKSSNSDTRTHADIPILQSDEKL